MNVNDRLELSDVCEGMTVEAWVSSNRGNGGQFQVEIVDIRESFDGSISRMELVTADDEQMTVYWPNAHVESRDLVPKDGSVGQLTGFYPVE